MLDPSTDAGLVAVLGPLRFIDLPARRRVRWLVKSLALGRLARYQCLLAGIGRVAIHALLVAMQQIGQWVFVVHVGRRHHGAVRQPALAVHADVQLHAEIPLLAFAGLVHVGVARLVGVLGGAGRCDDGGIHDGAGVDLDAARLQFLAYLGKQGFAQFVVIEQFAELQHRGGVGHAARAQVNAHEAAQAGTVIQGLLARQIGQVEPVLDEVDAQHALQSNGRAAVASLGVVRLLSPRTARPTAPAPPWS
jgi:hypothetical protein